MRRWNAPATTFALLVFLFACTAAPEFNYRIPDVAQSAPEAASGFAEKPGWTAQHFMVAAANPLATDAGYQVLKAGGTAVDAAIAVQMVLNLVEPQSSGIGGGAFLMHYDGKRVEAWDGRETAPAAATPDLFMKDGKPMAFMEGVVGGRSVGAPGVMRMLERAHREHGRLPWASLFAPAILLAEEGFIVSPRLASLLRAPDARRLLEDPMARVLYFDAAGQPVTAGTRIRNPELAKSLREIAARGSEAFYSGRIADEVIARVQGHAGNPGLLTKGDLANYQPRVREALCFDYKRWRVCGMPPPSSGPLAIAQMLGILSQTRTDIVSQRPIKRAFGLEPAPDAVHLITEAGRLAYADRARYVADPDFVPLPGGNADSLLAPAYLRQRAALIGPRSMGRAEPGAPQGALLSLADDRSPELPSTSHICIVDVEGHALSMTSTIENGFGAQIMAAGFLLNNQLTDFSFVPSENGKPVANRVEPGKRPRSSMSPLLVFERESGRLVMEMGSPGGSAIINYVAKTLIAMADWDLDAQQAVALPNFGSRNGPTELEQGRASDELVEALRLRGHEIRLIEQTSGLQAIQRMPTGWFGGADPRREGVARGD